MAETTTKPGPSKQTKKTKSAVGAPSQLSQRTRSGKRAWRKNVDIDNVEEGLEAIRSEERVIGTALHNQPDKDLFTVDVTGDEGGGSFEPYHELNHTPDGRADHSKHSQTEVTQVLEGSIDFYQNTISEIRGSRCRIASYEEIRGQLPTEGKTVADVSTRPPWAVQRGHGPYRNWSW